MHANASALHIALLLSAAIAGDATAQAPPSALPPNGILGPDTITVTAGVTFRSSPLRRFFLGNTYRDYWTQPVRVPVLDLRTYAGGLEPIKEGGGMQTRSLRLGSRDGSEFVLRLARKSVAEPPARLRGTVAEGLFRDQLSAMYPAAGVVAAPIVEAAGVLNPTPDLAVLPDDSALGTFRAAFAGRLATIELYPAKPDEGPGFAGADDVIDSDELIPLLDSVPAQGVDDRAFLAARLTDFLLGDTDRHLGNWKWARFDGGERITWVPIARDRDHAFHHYDGLLARLASRAAPYLTTFSATYPGVDALSHSARALDRRLLAGLDRATWDSVARAVQRRITNDVIDSAVARMPAEFRALAPSFVTSLRARRDGMTEIAAKFYQMLAAVVDVHATNAPDVAIIDYRDDGHVDVVLRSGTVTYYRRLFDPHESKEVRVYLHDGDDSVVVRGNGESGIVVRVVGGNGDNAVVDSSAHHLMRMYDVGRVRGVSYGPRASQDTLFDRRPWVNDTGALRPPSADAGSQLEPIGGLGGGSGLGLVPKLGVAWVKHGFAREPYETFVSITGEYSFGVDGYRVTLFGDHRLERSRRHYTATARMSDLEVINFHGLGNDAKREPDDYYHVDQRQWLFEPAVAFSLGRRASDVTFGPVVQLSRTSGPADRFVAQERPYGSGDFGQVGVRLGLTYDTRDNATFATRGFLVEANTSAFPSAWDVERTFAQVSAAATTFVRLPLPAHPVLAFRGGGRHVWGDAPFHELAFIGGRGTVRGMDAQRYAGDASVYGTSELRLPVASVRYVLPLDIGILGFADAGRVYVDGSSPGGWHAVAGGGFWLGILDQGTGVSVTFTSSPEKRVLIGSGLRF